MVLYCFGVFSLSSGVFYRRRRKIFALLILFLQFLLLKQRISKGFCFQKVKKISASGGDRSDKKAPPLKKSGSNKGGLSYQGGGFLNTNTSDVSLFLPTSSS